VPCRCAAPGVGSTFLFGLDLSLGEDARPARSGDLSGLRALVVDDTETNRTMLGEQLAAWGVAAELAADAAAAWWSCVGRLRPGTRTTWPCSTCACPATTAWLWPQPSRRGRARHHPLHDPDVGRRAGRHRAAQAGVREWTRKPVRLPELRSALLRLVRVARRACNARGGHSRRGAARVAGHVLVAEDNLVNQVVAEGVPAPAGYTVRLAADGREALRAWSTSASTRS
jgi:CheY-like chemotaxis protein